jgi:iron complex outermembrane receptor protein
MVCLNLFSQNRITFSVKDATTQDILTGVNIYFPELEKGTISDINGNGSLSNLPDGTYEISFSYIGYESRLLTLTFPHTENFLIIELNQNISGLEEVIITSNRANRSIAYTPSRVEVLTGEVEEAATMDPS